MTTIDITKRTVKQNLPTTQNKIEIPKFYVIVLEADIEFDIQRICPNCFIRIYKAYITAPVVIVDVFTCYTELSKNKKCVITKPMSKDVAETYLVKISKIMERYNNNHNLDLAIAAISAKLKEV